MHLNKIFLEARRIEISLLYLLVLHKKLNFDNLVVIIWWIWE